MVWSHIVKKNFEDAISRFGRPHERDGQTDGRTLRDNIGHACITSRGKNHTFQPTSRFMSEIDP